MGVDLSGTGSSGEGASLILRLFGRMEVWVQGRSMPPPRTRKGLWLLALLALRPGEPVERRRLAGLLWPESPDELALYNLRRSLTNLRDCMGAEAGRLLSPTPRSLALDLEGADVDTIRFDACLQRGGAEDGLDEAAAVYRGPLLEGCLEEWVLPERDAREQALLAALEERAAAEAASGNPVQAARRWREVLRHDPFREAALRGLMEALHAARDFAGATQAYQEFRSFLLREMNSEPSAETLALFRRLREAAAHTLRPTPRPARPSARRSLPVGAPPLIGRAGEVREVREALLTRRAVVLTGPGGVGKTRLALAVAEEVAAEVPGAAAFTDLIALSDPALVAHAVAQALGIRVGADRSPESALLDFLRDEQLLLVLDNCEHLAPACKTLTDLMLRECPSLLILATSRHVLEIPNAAQFPVPPLTCPKPSMRDGSDPSSFEAIRYFVDRAQRALPGFELTPRNALAVGRICARLDGMPLALDLAAARVRGLTPEQIAARLDDLLPRLLTLPAPDGSRHRTLRAAMEWSYGLLSAAEKALVPRLSVFAGGFTLDAAEAVCGGDGLEPAEMLDLLLQLLDRSLLQYDEAEGEGRYRLLETIRAYAAELLGESGYAERVRERHRGYYTVVAEEAESGILSPQEAEWLARLDREHDNFRATLHACRSDEERVRIAGGLWRYWYDRGLITEGLQWLEGALAAAEPTPAAAQAMRGAGIMRWKRGDLEAGLAWLRSGLGVARKCGDISAEAGLLNALGTFEGERGNHEAAESHLEHSLALFRDLRDTRGAGFVLESLAIHALSREEFDRAERLLEESESLLRATRCEQTIGGVLNHRALVAVWRGDLEAARSLLTESLAIHRRFGHRENSAAAACNLGALLAALGETTTAREALEMGIAEWRSLGARRGMIGTLAGFAWLLAAESDLRRAARVAAAAAALRERERTPLHPAWRTLEERFQQRLHAAMGEAPLSAARDGGARLSLEEAITLASAGAELLSTAGTAAPA